MNQFLGSDRRTIERIDTVSTATITADAFKNATLDALTAFQTILSVLRERNAVVRIAEARREIMPGTDFEEMQIAGLGLPQTVREVYRARNGAGYMITVSVRAYGPEEMRVLCGIGMDGRLIMAEVVSHTETPRFYTRVFDNEQHMNRFWGSDRSAIESIDAVSTATITADAFKNATLDALTAFSIVRSR